MPRFFVGNFDFEHRLANPGRQLPAKLQRLNAELATSWLAIADDGDYLWTPEPIEASFFEQAATDGLPRVIPVVSFNSVPSGIECVPWGWTDEIRQLCDRHGWIRNDPPDKAVRAANSRRLSADLEEEWHVSPRFSGPASSIQQIEQFVGFHGTSRRWVIKSEFGMSGRERLIGSGIPTLADCNWINKRLGASGVVYFEPWVNKLGEVGIQIDIPRRGEPRCIEIVPMIADHRGQYGGSQLQPDGLKYPWLLEHTSERDLAMDIALQAARRIQDLGYFGPVGIDSMQYLDDNQQFHIRPLQDINARWTMGRLCLGFRRMLKRNDCACWLHGADPISATADKTKALRILHEFLRAKNIPISSALEVMIRAAFESAVVFDEDQLLIQVLRSKGLTATDENAITRMMELLRPQTVGRTIPTSPQTVGDQPAAHQSLLWIR